jgi:hypothetical protein
MFMGKLKSTFLSIVLLNTMLFFALIAIHEISHVFVGYCMGCQIEKAILFDSTFSGPHTEMLCATNMNELLVYLGGLAITAAFSLSFLFAESKDRNISFISLGISVMLSSLDISMLLNMQTLLYPLLTSGLALVTAGEYFMGSYYFSEDVSFGFLKSSPILEE